MAIPSSTVEVLDGNLGAVPADVSRQQAAIGVCSSGDANTVYSFSSINLLRETLGDGPLVEYAAYVLASAGGPILCVKVDAAASGTLSSVTKVGSGTSTCATSGSAPLDSYQVVVEIVNGAVVSSGDATIKISLDNGYTFGPEMSLAAGGTHTIADTGILLTFSTSGSATVIAGNTYSFTTTAPAATVSEISDAIDALAAENAQFFLVQVLGVPADDTALAALAASVDSKMTTFETNKDFVGAMISAHDGTRSSAKSAVSSFASNRVAISYGFGQIISAVSQAAIRRPVAWMAGARASQVEASEDLAAVKRGALTGVVSIESNEEAYGGDVDLAGFTTARTHKGRAGFFLTNCRMKSQPGSDFKYLQHRRVMDIASRVVSASQLKYLNDKILVNATTGLIDKEQAARINADITEALKAAVVHPGHAVEAVALVDETENILSTETLHIDYSVTPYGYAKAIVGRIGFTNPALQKA